MYRKWHKFFIRKYVYSLFLILIILFLIKWNLSSKQTNLGSKFDIRDILPPKRVLLKPIVEDADNVEI